MKVRLFMKRHCPWSRKAMNWLDEHGVSYETLDVKTDAKADGEMIRLSGQTHSPVIDVDGKILADFDPGELEKFWAKVAPKK